MAAKGYPLIEGLGAAALAGVAFLALGPRDWLIAISAMDLIAAADLRGGQSLLAFAIYILLRQLLLLIPLLTALKAQKHASSSYGPG